MKLIYYLYATLAAGVDAMQSLVRMLCGLENYAMDTGGGSTVATSGDPLSNFILGVLGIGETSEVYSALNTVFWSLAVFALIILAITTMVAMVKAHYNEDSQQTNPWTYIYTAGKAIFTFAFIPIVTIIGFQLASFILRTLDNITAGAGNSSEVVELYGTSATDILKSSTDEDGKETYANYDMFGNLKPTSTTTFSGMLFNASMYGANRLRNNQVSLEQVQSTFNGLFGNESCSAFDSLTNDTDRKAYIANQVDYAFANSLAIDGSYSWNALKGVFEDTFIIGKLDPFKTNSITGFYKFHASVIWAYYDLMQFNFIVGFAGVFTTFGIMLSIVLALVSRLIKGVALFLVYPTLLGIAPMDNFKAFKSWATNFMQQIMLAFGSIVGINLLLLILPYVQNFKFFDYEILNYMMNVIMLVVGLVMAKDFMSMISGFVGGADANQVGEGMKGEAGNKIKQGVTGGARVVGGALRIGASVATAPIRAGKKVGKAVRKVDQWNEDRARKKQLKSEMKTARATTKTANTEIAKQQSFIKTAESDNEAINKDLHTSADAIMKRSFAAGSKEAEAQDKAKEVYKDARTQGLTHEQALAKQRDYITQSMADLGNTDLQKKIAQRNANDKQISNSQTEIAKQEDIKEKNTYQAILKSHTETANDPSKVSGRVSDFKRDHKILSKVLGDSLIERATVKQMDKEDESWKRSTKGLSYNETTGKLTGNTPVRDGLKDAFSYLGKKINEGIDGMSLGRTIADSFVKTIEGVGSGLGLDKVIKAATDEMGKSLTFKGGPFKPSVAGDALQKKQHAELMKQDKEQTTALNDIRKAIEELRKDTNKNAQEAKNNPKP